MGHSTNKTDDTKCDTLEPSGKWKVEKWALRIFVLCAIVWGGLCTRTVATASLVTIWVTAVVVTITFVGILLGQLSNEKIADNCEVLYAIAGLLQLVFLAVAGMLFGHLTYYFHHWYSDPHPDAELCFRYILPAVFVFVVSLALWEAVYHGFTSYNSVLARKAREARSEESVLNMRNRRQELIHIINTNLNVEGTKDITRIVKADNDCENAHKMSMESNNAEQCLNNSDRYLGKLLCPSSDAGHKTRSIIRLGCVILAIISAVLMLVLSFTHANKATAIGSLVYIAFFSFTLFFDFQCFETVSEYESNWEFDSFDSKICIALTIAFVAIVGISAYQWPQCPQTWYMTVFHVAFGITFLLFCLFCGDLKNLTAKHQLEQLEKDM